MDPDTQHHADALLARLRDLVGPADGPVPSWTLAGMLAVKAAFIELDAWLTNDGGYPADWTTREEPTPRACPFRGVDLPDSDEAVSAHYDAEHRDEPHDDEDGCPGHESLAGAHMGESVYCDGSCARP